MKQIPWLLIGALFVLAVGLWQWLAPMQGAGGPKGPQGGFAIPVMLAKVEEKPLDVRLESVGTLIANESVVLRPEITGRITQILFTEGEKVKKGAKLFQLDDRMARAEVKQANATLNLARLNFDRFKKLANTGAATKRRYDEARAELSVAEANLDVARTRLDYTSINAPFDGVVGLRNVSPGELVNMGQALANFLSHDPMKVNFSIPETKATKLTIGQTVDLSVEALPGERFTGEVYALDPQLDVEGRAVSLRAKIPNPNGVLRPGYFARIKLLIAQKPAALVVPESAIVPNGDQKFVYLLQPDNGVMLVPVTLGERLAGEVEITAGLNVGDKVVTSGQIKLRPGVKVMDIADMPHHGGPNAASKPGKPPEKTQATATENKEAASEEGAAKTRDAATPIPTIVVEENEEKAVPQEDATSNTVQDLSPSAASSDASLDTSPAASSDAAGHDETPEEPRAQEAPKKPGAAFPFAPAYNRKAPETHGEARP